MTNGPQLSGMRNILFLDNPNERMNRILKECTTTKYLDSLSLLFQKYASKHVSHSTKVDQKY